MTGVQTCALPISHNRFFIPINVITLAEENFLFRQTFGLPGFIPFVGEYRRFFVDEWHLSPDQVFRQKPNAERKLLFTFKQSRAYHVFIYLLQKNSTEAGAAPGILGDVFCMHHFNVFTTDRSLGTGRPPAIRGWLIRRSRVSAGLPVIGVFRLIFYVAEISRPAE